MATKEKKDDLDLDIDDLDLDGELDEESAEEKADDEADEPVEDEDNIDEEEFTDDSADPISEEMMDFASDVPVQVVAVLGKRSLSMKELLNVQMGQVIELNRPLNEVVDLVANGKLLARGELVNIDGKMGVRIIKMMR